MAEARKLLPGLMNDEVLERLLDYNPDLIQVVKGPGIPEDKIVFNGAMSLTEAGAEAIVAGRFDGANSELGFIAKAGAHQRRSMPRSSSRPLHLTRR